MPALILALGMLRASPGHANGRMPGANDVVFDVRDPSHLVVRATFGIVQTFDAGKRWSWICEQAIDVSGVVADPPLGMTEDGSLVLLPPTGSALISRDHGCSWPRAGAPLAARQGVDLTTDPSDPKPLFALLSTVIGVDAGYGVFDSQVLRTRDDARSWESVAMLPSDFQAETLELAKSNPQRMYVSGTDSMNPRLGVLFVSDDGGAHFTRRTLDLPAGSGSLLISGIHPHDPDTLWLRVPARGDSIGILPARLYMSHDAGQSFRMLASTQRAMFGFAVSPDGSQLAYGGPSDGLYVGASDGNSGFQKRGSWGIRCLRWTESGGLYACASEPTDPFSLGVSDDSGVSFRALYKLADTCPAECAEGTQFGASCQAAWTPIRPLIRASAEMCSVPWAQAPLDAGTASDGGGAADSEPAPAQDAGSAPDANEEVDADVAEATDASDAPDSDDSPPMPSERGDGCNCSTGGLRDSPFQGVVWCAGLAALWLRAERKRRSARSRS
jgi:photosystem II stability/assembly factor-like uncharacterized protein